MAGFTPKPANKYPKSIDIAYLNNKFFKKINKITKKLKTIRFFFF